MTISVPRGTAPHWSTRYPTAASFQEELAAREAENAGYQVPDPLGIGGGEKIVDYLRERRRVKAAGYAHMDFLCVDGGPMVEPRPVRRRLIKEGIGWACAAICALGLVGALYGVL